MHYISCYICIKYNRERSTIYEEVASVLPNDIILRIRELSDIYHDNNELSTDQIDSILNNAKDEFIKTFNK